jgi:leucyl-tRNA---protein transferase
VARLLHRLLEAPRPCSYLPDRPAALEHQVLVDVGPEELEGLLLRGWRRFGPQYFRPACGACSECVPTRVPTASFVPTKSQRRARKACADLVRRVGVPRVTEERLALYHLWHASREEARDWSPSPLDARTYAMQFAFPHPAARELTYYEGDGPDARLVGVGICDETPTAWSAVYFFYHPDWAKRSLGVANVLFQIELARAKKLAHVYLGYRIDASASMKYKAQFQPQERLIGWPSPDETAVWSPADRLAGPLADPAGARGRSS